MDKLEIAKENVMKNCMKELEQFYTSAEWRQLRAKVMKANSGLCENCLRRGLYRNAKAVHTIQPWGQNTTDLKSLFRRENLICLCRECHAAVHAKRLFFQIDGINYGTAKMNPNE